MARNLAIARKRTRFRAWSFEEMFGIFSALEHLMQRECENLSGGEMQMVAISRALLGAPGLVLFDEPSQGLAPKIVQDVMATVSRLRDEGISALVVEQNAATALGVSDRATSWIEAASSTRGRRPSCWPATSSAWACWGSDRGGGHPRVRGLVKRYARGVFQRRETFRLQADLTVHDSAIVGSWSERLGEDHAVRADHGVEPAERGYRAGHGRNIPT